MNKDFRKYRFEGIDLNNPSDIKLLNSIQGNILKSHGRKYSSLILISAKSNQKKDIARLKSFLKSIKITSASDQLKQAKLFKESKKQALFASLLLSYQGYLKLGVNPMSCPGDYAFRMGQKARIAHINESGNEDWQPFYKTDIDYLILVAHNLKNELNSFLNRARKKLNQLDVSYHIEHGNSIKKRDSFGFKDGLSQPLFFKKDIVAKVDIKPRYWDSSFDPKHLVLIKDSLDSEGYGSYVVFRKIEQFVDRFENSVARLSKVLKADEDEVNYCLMGRYKEGKSKLEESKINNFNYVNDYNGDQCPYSNHIRKANPRENDEDSIYKSMIRRGFLFKEDSIQGLHFMAYMQDISRQFEFVQKHWLNNKDYPKKNVGYDPIANSTGLSNRIEVPVNGVKRNLEIDTLTQVLGGEYFYAPSPKAIRML